VNVLHVITTLDVGGAEMHLLAQVRGQAARGLAPSVAYLKGAGTLAAEARAAGAREVVRVAPTLPGLVRLARRARRADLVHTHLLKADVLGALAAALAGRTARLVSSKHNDEQVLLSPAVSFVHGLVGRLPRRTIVLSDHVGRFFVRHGRLAPERLRRVYYGIDPAPFERAAALGAERRAALRASLGLGAEDAVFTCVARFAPQKAHDVLLQAFAAALERAPPGAPALRLLLVGDDPFGDGRRRAEALARELGLGARAVFAGIRRDVPELLGASDAFVLSSLWEGLGLVFLEAMAAGLPVLATRVSAVPEVVVEGETGLLVPAADAGALADGLLRLAADPELRRRLGAAGRARVRERFGLARMVAETLDVYAEVAGPTALSAARR
jgi:glycosyltransferase involved in cell wall biosynthesis